MNLGWMSATVYWLNFCCSGNLSLPLKSLRDSRLPAATIFSHGQRSKCADLTELLPARRFLAGGVDSNQQQSLQVSVYLLL